MTRVPGRPSTSSNTGPTLSDDVVARRYRHAREAVVRARDALDVREASYATYVRGSRLLLAGLAVAATAVVTVLVLLVVARHDDSLRAAIVLMLSLGVPGVGTLSACWVGWNNRHRAQISRPDPYDADGRVTVYLQPAAAVRVAERAHRDAIDRLQALRRPPDEVDPVSYY